VAVGEFLIASGLALAVSGGSDLRLLPLSVGVGILLVAPFAIAKGSGHWNWPLAGVGAVVGFLLAFGLLFPVDDVLPTFAVAFGVGGAIALAWRRPRDLTLRAAAVGGLAAAAFAAAHGDARTLVWVTIVLAVPVVALADELARATSRR
jgi:hypothetical protein